MTKTAKAKSDAGVKAAKSKAAKPKATKAKSANPSASVPVPAIAPDLWPNEDAADQATLYAAENVFNHLTARVKAFQENLPAHHELGIQLANFGGEKALHVRGMGFRNPNIIEFYGLLDGDRQVAVVQHVSQLNFLLIAVPPVQQDKPYRIGFGAELNDPGAEEPEPAT